MPISPGPRIADGAGKCSSANWTVPKATATSKEVRKRWTSRILQFNLHLTFTNACSEHQADPCTNDGDVLLFLQDVQLCPFITLMIPFSLFNLSDWIYCTKSSFYQETLIPTLLFFSNQRRNPFWRFHSRATRGSLGSKPKNI